MRIFRLVMFSMQKRTGSSIPLPQCLIIIMCFDQQIRVYDVQRSLFKKCKKKFLKLKKIPHDAIKRFLYTDELLSINSMQSAVPKVEVEFKQNATNLLFLIL